MRNGPAEVTPVTPATIRPIPVKATPAVAEPVICRRSRCGYAESRYPGNAENLRSDVAKRVGENDGQHRQAAYQECSDTFAKDHCGLRPSTGGSKKLDRAWPMNASLGSA